MESNFLYLCCCVVLIILLTSGADPASKFRWDFSYIWRFQLYLVIKSHYGSTTVREMKYSLLDNTAVTKQLTAK